MFSCLGSNWPAARAFGSNSFDAAVFTPSQVFFAEMLGTMLLMFNVLSTIDIPVEGAGPLGVYPIAMSVMVAHLFLLPIDGCSINPTRSFGPAVVANWAAIPGNFSDQQHIFWFGPMFGAALAAFLYEYGTLKPKNFTGSKDMDSAIFEAGKKKTVKKNKKQPVVVEEVMLDAADALASPAPTVALKKKKGTKKKKTSVDIERQQEATSNPMMAANSGFVDVSTTDETAML